MLEVSEQLTAYLDPDPSGVELAALAAPQGAPLHIARVGAVVDIVGGGVPIDLTPELLRDAAETTQALIDAGTIPPISFEHGIERGNRGDMAADRAPYGYVTRVWFDEEAGAVYGEKRWTERGASLVSTSRVEGDKTALFISPAITVGDIYHPTNTPPERIGGAMFGVVSITTTPRQNSMEPVPLSRPVPSTPADAAENQKTLESDMVEKTNETLLTRGTETTTALLGSLGLPPEATAIELTQAVEGIVNAAEKAKAERDEAVEREQEATKKAEEVEVELSQYRKQAEEAEAKAQAEAIEAELTGFGVEDAERDLYRQVLTAGGDTADLARATLSARTAPDPMAPVNEAIEGAKERGALPGGYVVEGDAAELAKANPETFAVLLAALPDGMVVRTGAPAGDGITGTETSIQTPEEANAELHRIAAGIDLTPFGTPTTAALNTARSERPDLVAIVTAEN